jgi:DNA mismatch repair protein MutS
MIMSKAIEQYNVFQKQYPNAVILMQMGDFFEAFGDGAKTLHEVCGLTITNGRGVPMAGVPYWSIDSYIAKIVKAGYKTVLVENTNKEADGTITRDIIRIVNNEIIPVVLKN